MNCAKARAQFSAYVEQELSESDRRAVSAHLGRCEHCSRDLFAMQKAVNLLRWVPKVDARPGFEDRLSERLHAPADERPASWTWLERWRELGQRLEASSRAFFGETLVATPASALLLAVLVGTGGGALVMHQVMRSSGTAPAQVASTPEIMSAPGVASRAPQAAEPATLASAAPAGVTDNAVMPAVEPAPADSRLASAAATSSQPPAATPRPQGTPQRPARRIEAPVFTASQSGRVRPGMEVAPWAKNQQPIEGPPSVSQVEYILDLVDVNQERVLQLPASAVVSGGTVTF